MLKFKLALLGIFTAAVLLAQNNDMAAIQFLKDGVPHAGIDVLFKVVAQQSELVKTDQLQVFLTTPKGKKQKLPVWGHQGEFRIHPNTKGRLDIQISLAERVETYTFWVKRLPIKLMVGGHGEGTTKPISHLDFKSQKGVYARMDCCDIQGKCRILSYDLIRIIPGYGTESENNLGGYFSEKTQCLVDQGQPGDIYFFRNVFYQCPGSGGKEKGNDFSLELK
ncbi:MAG: hypothetical protein AAGF89_14925 [Bacteroidota bacterium]